jgi:hypothetical protein
VKGVNVSESWSDFSRRHVGRRYVFSGDPLSHIVIDFFCSEVGMPKVVGKRREQLRTREKKNFQNKKGGKGRADNVAVTGITLIRFRQTESQKNSRGRKKRGEMSETRHTLADWNTAHMEKCVFSRTPKTKEAKDPRENHARALVSCRQRCMARAWRASAPAPLGRLRLHANSFGSWRSELTF